jgi:hypothetical protein
MLRNTPQRLTVALCLVITVVLLAGWRAGYGQESTASGAQQNKQTLLQRMKRHRPTFRGDKPGQIRVKWEWYDSVVGSYRFEKRALTQELSAGEKFLLREEWVFGETKVTFQEIFDLGSDDDDKLVPILSHYAILASAPAATFEGLTLYGKQGEVKGPVTRKYMAPGPSGYGYVLEYKSQNGSLLVAAGLSYDAINARWKDIKDRIADEESREKAAEDLRLLRAAYEKAFSESEKAR